VTPDPRPGCEGRSHGRYAFLRGAGVVFSPALALDVKEVVHLPLHPIQNMGKFGFLHHENCNRVVRRYKFSYAAISSRFILPTFSAPGIPRYVPLH
jgi:hypothetical protein